MIIEDGRGHGHQAGITQDGQLTVLSTADPISGNISFTKADYYICNSDYSATADDTVLYLKNDNSFQYFRICRIILSSSVLQKWTIYKVASGTAGGTAITPLNANFSSGKAADLTVYGDAAVTGSLTSGGIITRMRIPATQPGALDINGTIVLSVNTALAVSCDATGDVSVSICGWFADII